MHVTVCGHSPDGTGNVRLWGEGRPEYPEKNFSGQAVKPTTNSTHIWCWVQKLNPGQIGGRQRFSPLWQPCYPQISVTIHWHTWFTCSKWFGICYSVGANQMYYCKFSLEHPYHPSPPPKWQGLGKYKAKWDFQRVRRFGVGGGMGGYIPELHLTLYYYCLALHVLM